ncbi:unnamed protein product [Cladocopium goreaui]|uniref:HNH endonuclease n=1 Tax=Cladocopium goreaui TaxID=2562237 RepID=A0A9P1BRP0_9DINO|nr:unnamed protein product [Cladocopium goreaui]
MTGHGLPVSGESLQDGRLRISAHGRQRQVPLIPGNAAPTAGPVASAAPAAPAAPTIAPTTAPTGPAVTALAVTTVPSVAPGAAKVHTVKTEVREVREVTEKTDEEEGEDEDGADRKDKEHKDQGEGKDEGKPKEEKVTQMPGWTIAAGGVLLAAGALGVYVWSRRPEPKLKQDKPRTSILSRRLRGSVELKIFYGIAALGLTQDLVPISSPCLSTCPSLSTLSPIAFSEGFSMVPHLELCAAPDSPNKRRSNMSAAEEKGARRSIREGSSSESERQKSRRSRTEASKNASQRGSLSRKDPEKSKGSKAANPDHAEVIATEGAAAKGGYKNRKQQATRAADAKKQTDETIVPLATDQPAAAEKPAEGTPPTPAASEETPAASPAVPDAAIPKNEEASAEGTPADTTTSRPSAYRSRKQNQPAAAEKPAEGTPPTPAASEETPAASPAVPDAAIPKNEEASAEGTPADTTTSRPSAYRSRKQNQPAAAEKPAEGTPPTPAASEETPAASPAAPDAATPKNGEASAEGTPADTTTARPSAYRSRKQNQPAAAEKPAEGTPPTPAASVETPAASPAAPDAATPKNGEASAEGTPADTTTARPSAYRSRKQNQPAAAEKPAEGTPPTSPASEETPAASPAVPDAATPKNEEASAEGTPADTTTARPSAYRSRKQNQPAAAEKPAEGTPPTPAASEETPAASPAVPDAATPKNGEASAEGTPADTTTARPSAYRSRKQNQPAAAEKPAEGTPPTPAASEETPAASPAVPDAATPKNGEASAEGTLADTTTARPNAATPKNGEASAEGTPADTTTARPSAYRSRKQNQPAAAEKPAEGTPPTSPVSEETPAASPAVPDAATPKNEEASAEGTPADTTTARPSAYRSRKQNQSSSGASSGPSATLVVGQATVNGGKVLLLPSQKRGRARTEAELKISELAAIRFQLIGAVGTADYGLTLPTGTTEKLGKPSGLKDTDELFAAGLARVSWKRDSLELGDRSFGSSTQRVPRSVTYGAMLEVESYGGNGGGAFLGLVREKSARIRPTLLGQTFVRTVTVDLRAPGEERLLLSTGAPSRGSAPAVPLVDLRPNGAPVRYYAVEATALRVAGQRLELTAPLIAVIDTGTTGLGLPSALFESYDQLRRNVAQEFGLQRAQEVDLLLRAEDGSELSLSMRPGRQKAYKQDRFDIVTALPEPSGMNAEASALWTGQGLSGAQPMKLRDGKFIAQAPSASIGWVQADRPVSRGDRFLVRLLPSGPGRLPCNGSVGLAPRGARLTERLTQDTAAYGTEGKLIPGDLVECRLADDGSGTVTWRVNGKEVASPASLNTGRNVYPTVDAYLQFKLHQFAAVVLGLLCFRNLNLGLVDLRRLEVKQSSFFEEFNLLVHFDPP